MDKKINPEGFEAFVVKAFKLTAEDLASLYNEAGELTDFSLIEQKDTERIQKLSTEKTNQYNRGLKEASLKLEKDLKEKYDVDSDLIGSELFDHIIETKLADVKAPEGDIMKNPDVIKLVNQHTKEKKLWNKELEDKLKAKEEEIISVNLFKEVESAALAEFENLNPILPSDAKKASALKAILINDLKKNKYQKDDSGFIVLKEDGTPLQDLHANNVNFQDHIKGTAERYFDFKVAEERTSSGLTEEQRKQQGAKIRVPKSKDDYVSMMKDNSLTPQERIAIKNKAVEAKII